MISGISNFSTRSWGTVGATHLLCASQPSVSNTIRHLEDMLGFDLFDRVKARVVPTEEANAVQADSGCLRRLRQYSSDGGGDPRQSARFTNFGKNHPLPGRTLFRRATSPTCHLFRSAAIPSWVGKSRRHLPTLVAPARSISRCVTGETACALDQKGAGIAIVDQFVLMGEAVFSNLAVRAFEPKTDAKMCFRSKLRRLSL